MQEVPTEVDIGKRIGAWRLQRGMSQGAVARRAGIDPSYLSRIESGKVHPTVRTALRVSAALRVSLDDLLGPSPPDRKDRPCPASASGSCLLDLIETRSAAEHENGVESYSPRQIRVLRRFMELLRNASPGLLAAVEVVVGELAERHSEEQAG